MKNTTYEQESYSEKACWVFIAVIVVLALISDSIW